MKQLHILTAMLASLFLTGCATSPSGMGLETVGPAKVPTATVISTNGRLVVYSAYEVNADFNARDPDRPEHSDYRIFAPDGKLLQRVHNNTGTLSQEPVSVTLPPGRYVIKALANGYGFMAIPVVIAAQQSTIVHLEGGAARLDTSGFNRTNVVCLPDGQVIGWKVQPTL